MTTTSTFPRSSSSDVTVRWTGEPEGDLGLTADSGVEQRRRAVWDGPWAYLRQVHGCVVHVVDRAGAIQGADGDALVTAEAGVALAVFTADCAPVAFTSAEGVIGVAHAGWRGLAGGVLAATVDQMRAQGATQITASLGPCIRAECYEFGERDLRDIASLFGETVVGRTREGKPALDVPAAVRAALTASGVPLVAEHGACTACSPGFFSYRARRDHGRQASLVVRG